MQTEVVFVIPSEEEDIILTTSGTNEDECIKKFYKYLNENPQLTDDGISSWEELKKEIIEYGTYTMYSTPKIININ